MSNGRRESARDRIARDRAEQARSRRRRRWLTAAGAAVVVIAAAVGITLAVSGGGQPAAAGQPLAPLSRLGSLQAAPDPGPLGPEGVPVPAAAPLASTATVASGQPVDGISCQTDEQTLFHIHAHLTVFVNGSARQVPAAIGIPGAQATATPQGPFMRAARASTGCIRTPVTASSTSNPRSPAPTPSVTSSTCGASRSARTRSARPPGASWPSTTGRCTRATRGTSR